MNKNEILQKAQKENRHTDERQLLLQQRAGNIASVAALVLCLIIAELENIFNNSTMLFYCSFSIYWCIIATNNLFLAIFDRTTKNVICTIIAIVFFIFSITILLLEHILGLI